MKLRNLFILENFSVHPFRSLCTLGMALLANLGVSQVLCLSACVFKAISLYMRSADRALKNSGKFFLECIISLRSFEVMESVLWWVKRERRNGQFLFKLEYANVPKGRPIDMHDPKYINLHRSLQIETATPSCDAGGEKNFRTSIGLNSK